MWPDLTAARARVRPMPVQHASSAAVRGVLQTDRTGPPGTLGFTSGVAGEAAGAGSRPRESDDLLPLALSRPREALARARAVLAGAPRAATRPRWPIRPRAIVLRDVGDVEAGVRELRSALRLARRTGSAEREADVLASLGVALVYAGRTAAGLAAFDQALAAVQPGPDRRGCCTGAASRCGPSAGTPAALDDLRRAISVLQRAGDRLWTARALSARGLVYLASGRRAAPTPTSWPPAGCSPRPARTWKRPTRCQPRPGRLRRPETCRRRCPSSTRPRPGTGR